MEGIEFLEMNDLSKILLREEFGISEKLIEMSSIVENRIKKHIEAIGKTREYNQLKVIRAMQKNSLSDSHFNGTTGYGYDDRGREVLDAVYADVFKAEDAIVRHSIVNGTQALAVCMYGCLRPGDEFFSITGNPYDTLEEVIGIRGKGNGSLMDFGITYKQNSLTNEGEIDVNGVIKQISQNTKMIYIQRSRGYSQRPALTISSIENVIKKIKETKKDVIVMVDNCYGEFVEEREPIEAGADLIAGSLIKNPGGGLAPSGGYIAGRKDLVKLTSYRLTTPGMGKKVGATLGNNRLLFQGLFMAPHVVAESLKGAVFCAAILENIGLKSNPSASAKRSDIIQSIQFESAESLIAFCQGIQKGSPVDSFVEPLPWDMPGYDSQVIMAAGAFIQGASIELSADAPIKPPYTAYLQGGLVYEHVKLGVMTAIQKMLDNNMVKL